MFLPQSCHSLGSKRVKTRTQILGLSLIRDNWLWLCLRTVGLFLLIFGCGRVICAVSPFVGFAPSVGCSVLGLGFVVTNNLLRAVSASSFSPSRVPWEAATAARHEVGAAGVADAGVTEADGRSPSAGVSPGTHTDFVNVTL
ncbi:hypothetical protein F2Q69_00058684 [Brassica cretica]|uniref:Uncharacterized protein n=1 Tax=Brassica cretica TaxID=69181 RepID=A0A8S9RC17_BRACR|nr:hypothetical protein F2Q69_00058684 [Brassica cretica]